MRERRYFNQDQERESSKSDAWKENLSEETQTKQREEKKTDAPPPPIILLSFLFYSSTAVIINMVPIQSHRFQFKIDGRRSRSS